MLGLAVAVSASAGINKAPLQKNVAKYNIKAKTEYVTPFKQERVVEKKALRAPVTEQPEGEVRNYQRSGDCLFVDGGYVEHGTQDGFVTLIFADNNIVWFKNIFYKVDENFGDSYVYGTLSEDGTKITVPMGQSIYWSDYYNADVVLSYGTSSVGSNIVWTPDESVTEVVYAIDGNTITLQGCGGATPSGSNYPEYEYNGLGSVWTDDGTFGGYLEWETVFTFVVFPNTPVITVEPGVTTADVDWAADENSTGYNLRWRPWTDLSGNPAVWAFALEDYENYINDFWVYDADGDGYGWGLAYSSSAQDDGCIYSYSWSSSTGSLSPDNYIGTPDVPLKGKLQFTVWGTSDSWPDTYQVYAMVGEDLYQLFEEDLQTTAAKQTLEVDLSEFEGAEGCIVFRHYNCTNQYAIYIDDIMVGDLDNIIEPAEWHYENGITDDFFEIEGLTPETKYEVQVQGYNEDFTGDWCDIVEFTTLPEPVIPDVYILGEVNDQTWNPNVGTQMDYDAENNIYTKTVTIEGTKYFSFTNQLGESWDAIAPYRFGAVSEGDFYWLDGMNGMPLDLTYNNGQAVRVEGNGEYIITVDLANMKFIIEKVEAPHTFEVGDVNHDGDVNIADVTTLIDYLLGHAEVCPICADINGDEDINIADVTALIDKLLGH